MQFEQIVEQVRGAWRFRWLALAVAWALSVLGWLVVWELPNTFQATARVFVDTRTALSEVTRGITVDANLDTQLLRVRQALLGGPQLVQVAEQAGLYSGKNAQTALGKQEIVDELRARIDIEATLARDAGPTGAYLISYTNRDRAESLKVVEQLVSTFVGGTLGGKRESSAQAEQFLQTQIADYERQLSAAEERLADFKKRNVGLMPGTQGDYFTRLQAELDALSKAQANYDIEVRRRNELQRQLRGEQPLVASSAAGTALPPGATSNPGAGGSSAGTPAAGIVAAAGAPRTGSNDADIATRIRETQARLDELLLRFTDKHPDVIALRATLEDLKRRQQAEFDAARAGDPGAVVRSGLINSPVFQASQLQLNQAEVDLAALSAEIGDRQHRVAQLRSLVNTAPEVEAEFARLNRDYDVTRAQHHALVERLERAKLSQDADATGVVHFEVIEPPTASYAPISPNRPLLIAVVTLLALGAGGALAYLLNQLQPAFMTARELAVATQLPVLGAVSLMRLDSHRVRARLDAAGFAATAAGLVVCSVLVLLLQIGKLPFLAGAHV